MNLEYMQEMELYTIIDLVLPDLPFVKRMRFMQKLNAVFIQAQNKPNWEKFVFAEIEKLKEESKTWRNYWRWIE